MYCRPDKYVTLRYTSNIFAIMGDCQAKDSSTIADMSIGTKYKLGLTLK